MIKGQITYHDDPSTIDVPVDLSDPGSPVVETMFPAIRLNGTVKPILILANSCQDAIEGIQTAVFEGTYRSQDAALSAIQGEFRALVFDQGEPSGSSGDITGDEFSIQLVRRALQRVYPRRLHRGRQHPGNGLIRTDRPAGVGA